MINAVHALIYAHDPDAARAFFRDVLELPHVATGSGWIIFKSGPSQLTVHARGWEQESETTPPSRQHEVALMCDDLAETMADLTAKGANFTSKLTDEGWGLTAILNIPGAGEIMLYQPKYEPTATD